jgi:sigma-B regulation protein RsbU (phosphoserine phosphatase)
MNTLPGNAAGMKVLVVDDALDMRLYLGELLSKWGFEVVLANNGLEACERLERGDIRLVISDWMMPQLSGLELCRAIRAAPLPNYIFIILLTSRSADNDLLEGLAAGADDFLTKPFNADELHARIKAAQRVLHLEQTLEQRNRELMHANRQLQQSHDCIRRDLEAAAAMQRSMLPPDDHSQDMNLQSLFCPAAVVAGDIFSYLKLDDCHLAFYNIDVAGHGVRSAMLSFTLGKMLSATVEEGSPVKQRDPVRPGAERITPPAAVIAELNRRFQDKDEATPYFTMIYGVLNTATGRVRMCLAGHPNPYRVSRDGCAERLGSNGFPVGLLPDASYEDIEFQLRPGDRLFCYSDGIIECMDAQGRQFSTERLIGHLLQTCRQPLTESLAELRSRLQGWRRGEHFDDDVSMIAIEFQPAPAHGSNLIDMQNNAVYPEGIHCPSS